MTEIPFVHVVRHAQVDNPGKVVYGRMDGFGLLPEGFEQAKKAGEFLKEVVQDATATLVGTSRLFGPHLEHASELPGLD